MQKNFTFPTFGSVPQNASAKKCPSPIIFGVFKGVIFIYRGRRNQAYLVAPLRFVSLAVVVGGRLPAPDNSRYVIINWITDCMTWWRSAFLAGCDTIGTGPDAIRPVHWRQENACTLAAASKCQLVTNKTAIPGVNFTPQMPSVTPLQRWLIFSLVHILWPPSLL